MGKKMCVLENTDVTAPTYACSLRVLCMFIMAAGQGANLWFDNVLVLLKPQNTMRAPEFTTLALQTSESVNWDFGSNLSVNLSSSSTSSSPDQDTAVTEDDHVGVFSFSAAQYVALNIIFELFDISSVILSHT